MMLGRKKNTDEDYIPCCTNCEWSTIDNENADTIYCELREKDMLAEGKCRKYKYDLLKRVPRRHISIPTLDPSLLED